MSNSDSPFPATTVDAVLAHMNSDHNDDNLLIVRAFGARDATVATMTTLDHRGGTWTYSAGGTDRELTVPWRTQISERPEIRQEIVALYDAACVELGVTPRPH